MSRKPAKSLHRWVARRFGAESGPGDARASVAGPLSFLGSEDRSPTTIVGSWRGHYGQFEVGEGVAPVHRLGVLAARSGKGKRHLVFQLDDRAGPTLELILKESSVHEVPGGWRITHRKHIGLGGGGAIGFGKVIRAVETEAPWLITGDAIDLGVILATDPDPVIGFAGFVHRVLAYVLIRERLRSDHAALP